MKIHLTFKTILLVLLLTVAARASAQNAGCSEPNIETAKLWWPDQRNVWTPIGWKDHYFRFNVIYNGAIVFEPYSDMSSRLHARRFKGEDFQVTFTPWPDTNFPALPEKRSMLWKLDGGHGIQGWETNHAAPVLWTDYPLQEGMVIREETFGHLQGGGAVKTGLEPLYAWVRLSVTHVDPLRAPTHFPVIAQLSKNYYAPAGHYLYEDGVTIDVVPKRAAYPRKLDGVTFETNSEKGMRVLEPDGKVRFAALPSSTGQLQFFEREPGVYALKVDLQAKEGDHIDLLMPMFPQAQETADQEMALGFDAALAQADSFWNGDQEKGATFHVPENYINEAVAQSVKFVPLISEKDYETGSYSVLSGSWGYDELWPTPSSMDSHMFLSLLGYHQTVAKYSELYRRYQGTIKPPGATYKMHPGYFGSPKYLTSIDWLADHGAVLLQVSTEALLSGDPKFIEEWTDPIIKACEFIRDNCALTNHQGVAGLLPPAVATDEGVSMQAVWSLAWNYKGLTKAVELLKRIHHPRAQEFETLAANYKTTFVNAFRKASEDAPRWKDDNDGQEYPKPPTTLWPKELPRTIVTDAFYLDGGPMVLVWAGLLDADDPLMQAEVKFFREGPNWKLKGPRFNAISRPVLEHEISTCEPCYSWNAFYSWKLGERERYLTAMDSVFAGALSQQTYISCEHRGGMQGNLFALPLAFWLARTAVIDDELQDGQLHLLRFCPLAWLSEKDPAEFLNMPTVYGPVNLQTSLSPGGKTLKVQFSGKWREKPGKVIVHLPPVPNLTAVNINGRDYPPGQEIDLTEY